MASLLAILSRCFNPHSSFRPSATYTATPPTLLSAQVSILTRAFARVQPGLDSPVPPAAMFQSSLELSPECNKADALPKDVGGRVSILTRAFARVQRRSGRCGSRGLYQFQSSLELSPECNLGQDAIEAVRRVGFNPHSSFRPSATPMGKITLGADPGFNPHSSFRPSATALW